MAEDLNIDVRHDDAVVVLTLNGYLNQPGGEDLVEACNRIIEEGTNQFVFNMTQCSLMNSVGASCLIEILEHIADKEGNVAFYGAKPIIAKTFRIMGLVQLSTVHEAETEALEAVKA